MPGVVVHRCRHIHPADRTRSENGLPITTVSRTILDVAETESEHTLKKLVDETDRRDLLDPVDLRATISRNRGRRAIPLVLDLLENYHSTPGANEGIEREFQLFVLEEQMPAPQLNALVNGKVVDCWWPDHRLVVELDSRDFHSDWSARERDLVRDAELLRLGIATMRVTWRRLRKERSELRKDLREQFRVHPFR